MLSSLRIQKLTRLFNAFDTDGSGELTSEDFDGLARRMAERSGVEAAHPVAASLREAFTALWSDLRASSDASGDGRVSLPEWLKAREALYADPKRYARIIGKAREQMFELLDRDMSGAIGQREYEVFAAAHGVPAGDVREIWSRIDHNGDSRITRDEFASLVDDFHMSDNLSSPGNWIFGKV